MQGPVFARHNSSPSRSSLTSLPLVVLVVATPPVPRLISPLGSAVEPLPHAPKGVHSASIGRIGVVDDTVLENEGAHARPFAQNVARSTPVPHTFWSEGLEGFNASSR